MKMPSDIIQFRFRGIVATQSIVMLYLHNGSAELADRVAGQIKALSNQKPLPD